MPFQHLFRQFEIAGRSSEVCYAISAFLPASWPHPGLAVVPLHLRRRCGQSARNVTNDESMVSEHSMLGPSNVMELNQYQSAINPNDRFGLDDRLGPYCRHPVLTFFILFRLFLHAILFLF